MVTYQQIVDLITSRIEPTEYLDKMLVVLKENEGKRLDERLIIKLRNALNDDSIRKQTRFGMTSIVWRDCPTGLLCAYAEKNVHVDSAWTQKSNTWAYEARDVRNAKRAKDLENTDTMERLAIAANQFTAAREKLDNLLEQFEDRHSLVLLCGDPDQYKGENLSDSF